MTDVPFQSPAARLGFLFLLLPVAAPAASTQSSASEVEALPTRTAVMKSLYGSAPGADGYVHLGKSHAAFWFERELRVPKGTLHSFFMRRVDLEDNGQRVTCHACSSSIDVVNYMKTGKGWVRSGTQRGFLSIGQWGEVPSGERASLLNATGSNPILGLEDSGLHQGYTTRFVSLIGFNGTQWMDLGGIQLGESNIGQCSEDPGDRRKRQLLECWSYDGELTPGSGQNQGFPDLKVKQTGTKQSSSSSPAPISSATMTLVYRFNGHEYAQVKSPK